ncbi:MAG: alpha/beta fold hydrolase, partial [Blastocatellia bacterium]
SPVKIHYREWGEGIPLLFMHGGWGYEIYPIDEQVEAFRGRFRILAPDRSGYGRSSRIETLPDRFHSAAAVEMTRFLDSLNIERAILWGHSDGAVIAAIMGSASPERFPGIVMEAFHYDRNKINSSEFFQSMAEAPDSFGERVCSVLARDHGDTYWRKVLDMEGRAWLRIIEESGDPSKDFFGGRLSALIPPSIFIHGRRDPRTERTELNGLHTLLPNVPIQLIEEGGHCPHGESRCAGEFNRIMGEFLGSIAS